MLFWIVAGTLAAIVAALLARPLLAPALPAPEASPDQAIYRDQLAEVLWFLTGDRFSFEFVPYALTGRLRPQPRLQFHGPSGPAGRADCVLLFSGGADSLAAEAVVSQLQDVVRGLADGVAA